MEQMSIDPVVTGDTKSLHSHIISFKSQKQILQNSIIPHFEESLQLRKNQEQKYLDNQDKLSDDRKAQLAKYTLDTKTRENDLGSLHELLKNIDPIVKVCDLVIHHTESMLRFQADKEETKNLMGHFNNLINEYSDFWNNVEKLNIFTDEGFNTDSSKLQMKAFKKYIDKLWKSNYSQMNPDGKNTESKPTQKNGTTSEQ